MTALHYEKHHPVAVTFGAGGPGSKTSAESSVVPCFTHVETTVGRLLLVGEKHGRELALCGIYFDDAPHAVRAVTAGACEDAAAFAGVRAQLDEYCFGARTSFDLWLTPSGSPFQKRVWRALAAIPYGTTTTYAAIAASIGMPRAARAVGAANGRNPLSIVVPCHRVIGKDGALTGYAGGLPNKRRLLGLESRLGSKDWAGAV